MTVQELIELLQKADPHATVDLSVNGEGGTPIAISEGVDVDDVSPVVIIHDDEDWANFEEDE